MSFPVLPPELLFNILSFISPTWRWGRLGWDRDRDRAVTANHARWFLRLRLVSRTFDDLVIDHVLAARRAGKLGRDLPLRRGPARPSTVGFVERLLRSLVRRASPRAANEATVPDGDACLIVRTIVDGAALSADLLTRRGGHGELPEEESPAELQSEYIEGLISSLAIIIGPGLILDILQPGHNDTIDMFGPLDDTTQQWRLAALMGAAYLGRIPDLNRVLSTGININSDPRDRWLYPPVMAAAAAGRVDVLDFLASRAADLHALTVGNGDNAVHFAAQAGHTEAVEWLIDHGVECDVVNNDGVTPLYRAACAGHAGVVRAIFTAKPESLRMEIRDSLDRAPIHWAVERGYNEVVQAFLARRNIDLEIQDGLGNPEMGLAVTPLVLAAAMGRDAIFHAILTRSGGTWGELESSPRVMCRCAIRGGSVAITRTIMETVLRLGEARPFLLQSEYLCLAASCGSDEVFQYLVSFDDAEINALPTEEGQPGQHAPPPVLRAAISSNTIGNVRAILDHPRFDAPRVLDPAILRRTAHFLQAPLDGLDPAILAALLAHPAFDANARDMYGRTALHYAASTGQMDLVDLLLAHPRIKVNPVDNQGNTPLCVAAEKGHTGVVRMFLDILGPAVWDAAGSLSDSSPLASAASEVKVEVVRMLLESRYRVPRDVVQFEMSHAVSRITATRAQLAALGAGGQNGSIGSFSSVEGDEEYKQAMLETGEALVRVLDEIVTVMAIKLEELERQE